MRVYPILVLLLAFNSLLAQYSSVGLNEKTIKRLAENSKNATLYIVISNEKDPVDAALVSSVKKYWKRGSYKYIAKAEYIDQKQKDALSHNNFYLCEWYENYDMSGGNALFISAQIKNQHSGVYVLSLALPRESNAKEKNREIRKTDFISMKFDLSQSITSHKVVDGYFDLMLKYFNHEIDFCESFVSIKDVKKEDKDGVVYFGSGLNDVQNKNILLIKEQVMRVTGADKKNMKGNASADAVMQFKPPQKNVYTVFPEDIKMALDKGDDQILIYSNDMLLSANNGAVIAVTGSYTDTSQKKDGFLLMAISILVLAYGTATIMK